MVQCAVATEVVHSSYLTLLYHTLIKLDSYCRWWEWADEQRLGRCGIQAAQHSISVRLYQAILEQHNEALFGHSHTHGGCVVMVR
jgi:hypothetical protein